MRLFIKTLTGQNTEIEVDSDFEIRIVKEIIQETLGIDPEAQRLIFAGKQLADDKTVADYNIRKESTLHLVLKKKGGSGGFYFNSDSNFDDEIDEKLSVQDLFDREYLSYEKKWASYQKNLDLENVLLDIEQTDVQVDFINKSQEICTFQVSEKFQKCFDMIISEALNCANVCKLQFGQLPVDRLHLSEPISKMINGIFIPIIEECLKFSFGSGFCISSVVFHDGYTPFNENCNMSYIPDKWGSIGSTKGVPIHKDDSDITINLCLGGDFTKSTLTFNTNLGKDEVFEHKIGKGLIHYGEIEHQVSPCDGNRFNMLIFLMKTSQPKV